MWIKEKASFNKNPQLLQDFRPPRSQQLDIYIYLEQEKLNILDFIEMQEIEFGIIMFLLQLKKPTPYISPAFIKAKPPMI